MRKVLDEKMGHTSTALGNGLRPSFKLKDPTYRGVQLGRFGGVLNAKIFWSAIAAPFSDY